ncbi:MAG: GNAT family N-acetyltransferase [Anaerolineaceae bacterium]|nr:GNAT family N-acetyltransferase [Anaerolineaceae bacterium]
MEIVKVGNKSDLQAFINLPYQLYENDPVWVAPLRSEQKSQFDVRKNPMLNHCDYALFLARQNGQVVGRISAFVDTMAVDYWKQPIGLFGSYECIDDEEISQRLLQTAKEWLQAKGMKSVRGPWSFASQEWGMVVEGFEPSPVILAPYNPPFYNDQLEKFGLEKVKDLIAYYIDAAEGYDIPDRYLKLTEIVRKRYGVRVRPVNMKNLIEEVQTILELSNLSIADNWGYYPVTQEEGRVMAEDMKMIINPEAILIAESAEGKPIGFAMSLPDVNVILKGLKGNLLPFGWLKLLTGLKKLDQYRMWGLGVIPEYQGKAIDTLLYQATYEAIYNENLRLEVNYVLEDNDRMNNALMKLGVKPLRRYRVYEMAI